MESLNTGLQLPKGQTKELKKDVKKVVVKAKLSDEEIKEKKGKYFTEKDIDKVYDEDIDVYVEKHGKEELLAKFRKNVIPKDIIQVGWDAFYETAVATRTRGAAAGPIDVKSTYWKKRKPIETKGWSTRYINKGKRTATRVNNNVFSSILGYFESSPIFRKNPCRLTNYTRRFFSNYKRGIPFIKELNACFKALTPDEYKLQLERAKKNPYYRIDDTAFSSITINRNFRTGLHMDDGDYRGGFGNLSVIERGKYSGGYTMFPQYKIGFDVRTGDYLAMNVHEYHCNTEITETAEQKKYNESLPDIHFDDASTGTLGSNKKYTRISFVCYLREKLIDCKKSETLKYYKKIKFEQ